MTDFDPAVRQQLELFAPVTRTGPDWTDVVARVRRPARRRPLVLALAAALALVAAGAGITAALGGFDRWLSGKPGKPAAASDQARFRAANGRSWAAFPTGTKLRQLIDTTVDGKRYVLFGFRSGNALCLELRAISFGHTLGPACTPASMVANLDAPITAVVPSTDLADKYNHPRAEFSYGIVADGVKHVDVEATEGSHSAIVGGNAYLWVESEPNTGSQVTRITAKGPGARVTTLAFPRADLAPGPQFTTTAVHAGPTRLQATIPHPRIGWYERREPRGVSIADAKLTPDQRKDVERMDRGFTRLVKPDPLSNVVVGLSGHLCLLAIGIGGGEGCSPPSSFFQQGPLNMAEQYATGGASLIVGAAADGVSRIVVFTADGQRQRVPLEDNLFSAFVPARQAAKVVGYDRGGRVVAIGKIPGFGGRGLPTGALRNVHTAVRTTGPNGASGTILVGAAVRGLQCWRATFSTGQSQTGCKPTYPTGPWTYVEDVQPAGRDLFVLGYVRPPVVRVRLRFADGSSIGAKPVDGLFLLAIPRAHLSRTRQLAFVTGYDAHGKRVQRQGVLFRTNA